MQSRGRQSLPQPGALLVQGCHPLRRQGKGSKIEVPFDVPEDGDYELYTEVAQASDYGIYTVLLDGKPPHAPQLEHEPGADVRPQTQFDGYAPRPTWAWRTRSAGSASARGGTR